MIDTATKLRPPRYPERASLGLWDARSSYFDNLAKWWRGNNYSSIPLYRVNTTPEWFAETHWKDCDD